LCHWIRITKLRNKNGNYFRNTENVSESSKYFPKFHCNVRVQRLIGWHEIQIGGEQEVVVSWRHVNHDDRASCARAIHMWVTARSRAAGCVSVRSLIGLHVRVPKRNTDFICPPPLVYASRPVYRWTQGPATRQFDPGLRS